MLSQSSDLSAMYCDYRSFKSLSKNLAESGMTRGTATVESRQLDSSDRQAYLLKADLRGS